MPRRQSIRRSVASRSSARTSRASRASTLRSSAKRYRVMVFNKSMRPYTPYANKTPFPDYKWYKLTYEQDFSLTVGTSGTTGTSRSFNLNSLYDPDRTGTGHQPYGYDALQIAYDRYKVFGVFVDLLFYNVQTITAVEVCSQMFNPSEIAEDIAGLNPDTIGERTHGKTKVLQNLGSGTLKQRFYVPIQKLFNITPLQYKADIDNTTAGTGSNPGAETKITLAIADPNGGSSGTVRCKIRLVYTAQFYQGKTMAQS